jgi:hypothetical protein
MNPPSASFDRLAYLDRLKAAGLEEDQARALTDALDAALREAIVTRADLRDLERKLETKIETATVDLLSDLSRRMLLAVVVIGGIVFAVVRLLR